MKDNKPLILAVDDSPQNLQQIHGLLASEYRVKVAKDGATAFKAIAQEEPDLILLDVLMPEMDGYEICNKIKADESLSDIPIIFLTAKSEDTDQEYGFSLGAADYISKPFSPKVTLARVKTHLELKRMTDMLKDQNIYLEQEVQARTARIREQTEHLQAIEEATILIVTSLAETRDLETGNHIRRTQYFIETIAQKLVADGTYADELKQQDIPVIVRSAPLHDIGKVGIPDAILNKRGKLTVYEFELMKTHAQLGLDAIEKAERQLGVKVDFLEFAKEIAVGHHEKWDGSGYPKGLSGREIPISARLMAIADVYDALVNQRCYKPAIEHNIAIELMREGRGKHFDPLIFDAFMACESTIIAIANEFRDEDEDANALGSIDTKL